MAIFKSLKKALEAPQEATVLKIKTKVATLPNELFTLTNLTQLYIQSSELKTVQEDIAALSKLETVNIQSKEF